MVGIITEARILRMYTYRYRQKNGMCKLIFKYMCDVCYVPTITLGKQVIQFKKYNKSK